VVISAQITLIRKINLIGIRFDQLFGYLQLKKNYLLIVSSSSIPFLYINIIKKLNV